MKQRFGFDTFRPGQQKAIESILQGQHTLVVMPTGAGKSLIYQFAALHVNGLTIVVAPLIALMEDQVFTLEQRRIPATYINSSLPTHEQRRRLRKAAAGTYQLVYVAPERFRNKVFRNMLGHLHVGLLAIDEAHCISMWGHDFRPDYRRIAEARELMGSPLTTAVTATATPRVQVDIAESLGLSMSRIVTGFNRPNLSLEVLETHGIETKLSTLHRLLTEVFPRKKRSGILIYAGTRNNAEEAARYVREVVGIDARYYHAGLNHNERSAIQEAFVTGRLSVVAATNAFGMGIDRQDIRMVIHYQMPGSLEAYYQEAGRAGRDGFPARAVLLYDPADRSLQDYFIEASFPSVGDLRALYETLHVSGRKLTTPTIYDLSAHSGLDPASVKVALEQLEVAGVIEPYGYEGTTIHLRTHSWQNEAVQLRLKELQVIVEHRRQRLQDMIAYAETDHCRRRHILLHFGDNHPVSAERCCDNCARRFGHGLPHPTVEPTPERLIVACVRSFPGQLTRSGVAKVLAGSKAKRIRKYRTSRFYGQLRGHSRKALTTIVDRLIKDQRLALAGRYVTVQGLIPAEQESASLSEPGIEQRIVAWGELNDTNRIPDLIAVLSDERYNVRRLAASALGKLRDVQAVNPLLELLAQEEHPQIRQYAVKALGKIGDDSARVMLARIASDENEKYYTREAAKSALKRLKPSQQINKSAITTDGKQKSSLERRVEIFLERTRPQRLEGPWDSGWALDYHSRIEGSKWERSNTGKLLFELKYEERCDALPKLGTRLAQFCKTHPDIIDVEALIPIPPSTNRGFDPVLALTRVLSTALGLTTLPLLEKTRPTAPQKDMRSYAQKEKNVRGAFAITRPVRGQSLLLVDDIYDSGATLAEATRILQRGGAIKISVLTVTKTIHTDA